MQCAQYIILYILHFTLYRGLGQVGLALCLYSCVRILVRYSNTTSSWPYSKLVCLQKYTVVWALLLALRHDLKIYYSMSTSKILLEIQDMGVIRGLEIYDHPKILTVTYIL